MATLSTDMLHQWVRVGDSPPTWQEYVGGKPVGPVLTNDEMLAAVRPYQEARHG